MRCLKYMFFLFYLGTSFFVSAQEENPCNLNPDKKVQKILDQALNPKKSDERQQYLLFQESVELDENCAICYLHLGKAAFRRSQLTNGSTENALEYLRKAYQLCPELHADLPYYLGVMSYGRQEYTEALNYFNAFLAFPSDDPLRLPSDLEQKKRDVEDVLQETKFYGEFYENVVPFNPKLVKGVSSPADEYLPMLSPDNELIFYTRKFIKKAKGDVVGREVEEFTVSSREDENSDFDAGNPLPAPFNVGDNYGGVSISLDNREMFITVCKPGFRGGLNCDLYVTTWEKSIGADGNEIYQWSGLENLGPNVNSDGWEAQPTLSADGNTLYFATARADTKENKDGNNSIDIYFSERMEDGSWSKAKTLGDDINTGENDKSPFLHVDSKTLYFSSNGRMGAGGYDIYYSRQNDDNSWSEPKNIGYPINSKGDEHGLIVSTSGKYAYYASNSVEGAKGFDIFSFELPQKARPEKVVFLKGDIRDEEGNIVKDARIELEYTKSRAITTIPVNGDDGSYAAVINLKEDEEVLMTVKSDSRLLAYNSRVFSLTDTLGPTVKKLEAEVKEVKAGESYFINDVNFETNSSDLTNKTKTALQGLAEFLNSNPSIRISIHGHTDNIGDPQKNLVLSTDRAFEVVGYLQELGINGKRMEFKGFGSTKPVSDNTTEEGRAKNRRTEFVILSK